MYSGSTQVHSKVDETHGRERLNRNRTDFVAFIQYFGKYDWIGMFTTATFHPPKSHRSIK